MKKTISLLSLIFITGIMALLAGCSNESIVGQWQLEKYCYGTDCTALANYGIVQIWEFTDEEYLADEDGKVSGNYFKGRHYQDSILNENIVWSLNGDKDSLLVRSLASGNQSLFYVSRFDGDTLELTSMINNILVRQLFKRL